MTRCQLLLSLLEDAGERGITTSEILQAGVGSRYGARLMELRKQGHRITSERVREGSWKYTLEGWKVLNPSWPSGSEPFCERTDIEVGGDRDEAAGGGAPPGQAAAGSTADLSALKLFESAA